MLKQLALALALVAGAAHADTGLHTDLPLSYLEQTQGDARNQPLVIFLHGFGIKDALPSTWTYLSVRAPLPVEPQGYRWFTKTDEPEYNGETDELFSSARLIKDFVLKATAKYHTQSDRVFLVGFSQGAIMSYEVALREPEWVRGIAALSGSVLPGLRSALKPDASMGKLA